MFLIRVDGGRQTIGVPSPAQVLEKLQSLASFGVEIISITGKRYEYADILRMASIC